MSAVQECSRDVARLGFVHAIWTERRAFLGMHRLPNSTFFQEYLHFSGRESEGERWRTRTRARARASRKSRADCTFYNSAPNAEGCCLQSRANEETVPTMQ